MPRPSTMAFRILPPCPRLHRSYWKNPKVENAVLDYPFSLQICTSLGPRCLVFRLYTPLIPFVLQGLIPAFCLLLTSTFLFQKRTCRLAKHGPVLLDYLTAVHSPRKDTKSSHENADSGRERERRAFTEVLPPRASAKPHTAR